MKKIPMLEKFAAQSLVYLDTGLSDGKELIFSKEKFAELIVRECAEWIKNTDSDPDIGEEDAKALLEHFGVEE